MKSSTFLLRIPMYDKRPLMRNTTLPGVGFYRPHGSAPSDLFGAFSRKGKNGELYFYTIYTHYTLTDINCQGLGVQRVFRVRPNVGASKFLKKI